MTKPETDNLARPAIHSSFTPSHGLRVVDFVCRRMEHQMHTDISLGGSWFKLFKKYDRDSSGLVDFAEMEHVLRKEVKIRKTEISDEELNLLWATFDSDGSGHVTIKEFSGFMRRYQKFGKKAFSGKIPITPMSNVKDLSAKIMAKGREMMVEDGKLEIDGICRFFQGSEYEQFTQWLVANKDIYDADGSGTFDLPELEEALHEFIIEMDRDRARLSASKSTGNLHTTMNATNTNVIDGPQSPMSQGGVSRTMNKSFSDGSLLASNRFDMTQDPHVYKTVAGYSSINRAGPIMGNIPNRASDYQGLLAKLKKDFDEKKEMRDRYEDTTFTGAPATSITSIPLDSYKAGAHMHNYVHTRWGGLRSRNDKPILIKGTILPPEEKRFLEQVRESHKPPMWPKPYDKDLHWCQKLDQVQTMSSLIRKQQRYEGLVARLKKI